LPDKNEKPGEVDVLKAVMDWKRRRRPPLKEEEVALSIRNLAAMNWLQVNPSPDLPVSDEMLM
jgi:hypothetical protein